MQDTLITITIVTFGFLLAANIYFRTQSFRTFKKLAELGVAFGREHVFDAELMEKEVLSRHPEHRELINKHIKSMKTSLNLSTMCIAVLTLCGAILMYYRE